MAGSRNTSEHASRPARKCGLLSVITSFYVAAFIAVVAFLVDPLAFRSDDSYAAAEAPRSFHRFQLPQQQDSFIAPQGQNVSFWRFGLRTEYALVCLHDLSSSWRDFEPLGRSLEKNASVYVLDVHAIFGGGRQLDNARSNTTYHNRVEETVAVFVANVLPQKHRSHFQRGKLQVFIAGHGLLGNTVLSMVNTKGFGGLVKGWIAFAPVIEFGGSSIKSTFTDHVSISWKRLMLMQLSNQILPSSWTQTIFGSLACMQVPTPPGREDVGPHQVSCADVFDIFPLAHSTKSMLLSLKRPVFIVSASDDALVHPPKAIYQRWYPYGVHRTAEGTHRSILKEASVHQQVIDYMK